MRTRLFNMISLTTRSISILSKPSIVERCIFSQQSLSKFLHTSKQSLCQEKERQVAPRQCFEEEQKEKQTFLDIVTRFRRQKLSDKGYVEFIRVALKYMIEFGVHKDLESYKALIDMLPKNKYIPRNMYQEIIMHYPSQQFVIIDVLTKMEDNAVLPDRQMESMLINIFGRDALVLKKYWRMLYWMPKFYNLDPWKPPLPVPTDPREVSKFAMWKVSSVDVQSYIEEFNTKDVADAIDHTWVVSTMSPAQEDLLRVHNTEQPLYIEGPFPVWVDTQSVDYFVLKGDPIKREIVEVDTDDVSDMKIPFWEVRERGLPLTVHEQEDGVYLAMCATGTSSKDSLLSWIRCLEKKNPNLKDIPIVFKIKSATEEKLMIDYDKPKVEQGDTYQESIDAK